MTNILELEINNKDWVPESMHHSIQVFIHDLKFIDTDTGLQASYNFSYHGNDAHSDYLHENLQKLEKDIDDAIEAMVKGIHDE